MPLTLFPFHYLLAIIKLFIQQLVTINFCFLFTTPVPLPPFCSSFQALLFPLICNFLWLGLPSFFLTCFPSQFSVLTVIFIFIFSRVIFPFCCIQHAKKVVSDSLGLVDFAIGLVNSVLNLLAGQGKYFEGFNLQKNCKINSAHQKIVVLVEMIFGVVNASFSLPKWQAVKMTFNAPCLYLSCFIRFVFTVPPFYPFLVSFITIPLSNAASLMLTLHCLYHFYLS